MSDDGAEDGRYLVVINDEEQYSVWPQDREIPTGWKPAGKSGSREECLDYIEDAWTDITPRSVQERMDAGGD